jgi:hypothetical protein
MISLIWLGIRHFLPLATLPSTFLLPPAGRLIDVFPGTVARFRAEA